MVRSQATNGMTIGKLAEAAGVGVETVRFYQRKGLIGTPGRDGGVRRYGEEDRRRLAFIRQAQTAGFTLNEIHELLALDAQVTDSNAALFDVANDFHGCIAGCHEVLRRQGLLEGTWCLDPHEGLSPDQADELTRVHAAYPHLNDDAFVAEHLGRWLAG